MYCGPVMESLPNSDSEYKKDYYGIETRKLVIPDTFWQNIT